MVADPENIAVNIPESGTLAPTGEYYVTSSYYKVVVIRVPLQGQNATIDKVLWIGLNLLPQDGFGKAPTTALCF